MPTVERCRRVMAEIDGELRLGAGPARILEIELQRRGQLEPDGIEAGDTLRRRQRQQFESWTASSRGGRPLRSPR
jgi:hypothetical protein